ncbi:MAG TPA: NAD-dependent epimerase/dehydratase family protein [Anaerohalosphaeraceae bacterium]|nr:NAD-dependent epimerase/dehydratase family protein [Anaerohalosphaeraceae bacterium]
MPKTVLITGAAGFAGCNLCRCLNSIDPQLNLVGVDIVPNYDLPCHSFHVADISDHDKTRELIARASPDCIIHLSGTFGTGSAQDIYRTNILSSTAILEAMRELIPTAIFISAGSAAEYGKVKNSDLPIMESAACNPVTPYGMSKHIATQIALYYHRVHNLCTMVIRPFQLIGKGVTDRLAPGAFAKRLLEAKHAGKNEIQVGNLNSCRDFLDVRDAVKAIWLLCQNPKGGEIFNLCSGIPVKIGDLLDLMQDVLDTHIKPVTEQSYLRGNADVDIVYGSCEKLQNYCGWKSEITLKESVESMFRTL